jgi:hypothetical protein
MSFNWIEKHSTNCKNCGHLVDERECVPEDDGDICQDCYQIVIEETIFGWDWIIRYATNHGWS